MVLLLSGTNVLKINAAPIQFPYGVESGDVTSNSAVLWTKVDRVSSVEVQVSTSSAFDPGTIKFKATIPATAANDFTLKTTATGLDSNTPYSYRWGDGTTFSEVGRFTTAPSEIQPVRSLWFDWSGDSDTSKFGVSAPYFGPWDVLKRAFSENNDFFIYLGDVIYSDLRANSGVIDPKTREPIPLQPDVITLDGFRGLYKDQKYLMSNPNLSIIPFYVLWDDHEVKNDWAGQTVDKDRYAKGKQAFTEYMPIKQDWAASDSYCAGPTQYRTIHWGSTVDIIILDTRSCRSDNAKADCTDKSKKVDLAPTLPKDIRIKFGLTPPDTDKKCLDAIKNPDRTMLGDKQKEMFEADLKNSKAKVKFVISSVNMQQTYAFPYDNWEGYEAERNETLKYIRDNKITNVIFLSTDSHLNLMNEVFIDRFKDKETIAHEIVAGPIAALTDEKSLSGISDKLVESKLGVLKFILGANCTNLNTYSYGRVTLLDNVLDITLKDKNGNVVKDELDPKVLCREAFRLS